MITLDFKARVPVIDANIGVGHRHDRPSPISDREELCSEMGRHGVERAVIYHLQGESISPVEANDEMRSWQAHEGMLQHQWMAGASRQSLDQLQAMHADRPLTSVRINNTDKPYNPFSHWIYGDLLEWCAAAGIPVWVSVANANCRDLLETLTRFPNLVTVLVGAHYVDALFIRPLLRNLPLAHLELSRYEVLGEVEALSREFGVDRLVYGSFYPRLQMGPILFYLHHLDLTEDELAAVCAGNVEEILAGRRK